MIVVRARVRECRYCEYEGSRDEMRAHVADYHMDRAAAGAIYREVLDAGGTVEQARAAYNHALIPEGAGRYDRSRVRVLT